MKPGPWIVDPSGAGVRLDKWLADDARVGSRAKALDALRRGRVFLDDVEQTVADAARPLAEGQTVRLWMSRPGSASRRGPRRIHGLDIRFEDDALLVVNKPWGLPVVPVPDRPEEPSLLQGVALHWRSHGRHEPLIVHRIDSDTSGLVVFARTQAAYADLERQFEARTPLRRYLAFVLGQPEPADGTWRDLLAWDGRRRMQQAASPGLAEAREAVTRYRILARYAEASLLELSLETGRQHQIRVQAMLHGHPLLGERLYVGAGGIRVPQAHVRQALHAARLGFEHPVSRRAIEVEAPLPEDLVALERRLSSTSRRT